MTTPNTFQDLSGTELAGENPFQDLIAACNDDAIEIQERYRKQIVHRNELKRAEMLSSDFTGMKIDPILAKLVYPSIEPGFEDPRNCLVFWARPTNAVRALIAKIQTRLVEVAPDTWTMPSSSLHMTVLEVAHSLTAGEIEELLQKIQPNAESIVDCTLSHRARLVKPHLNYDSQGLALQFLPATGEPGRSLQEDRYTYHHLRKDVFEQVRATGVKIASRYMVPSAHLTVARFTTLHDFEKAEGKVDHAKVARLVATIDEINVWLQEEYWSSEAGIKAGGEWIIGEQKGLELRKGTLWYGGGERVCIGAGF